MHFKQKPYTRNFRSASGDLLTGCLPLPERAIWWGAKSFQHRNDLPFSVKRLLLCVWAAVLGRSPCLGAWPCARLPLALVAGWLALAGSGGRHCRLPWIARAWVDTVSALSLSCRTHTDRSGMMSEATRLLVNPDTHKKKQKPDQFKVCVLHVLLYVVHTATGKK